MLAVNTKPAVKPKGDEVAKPTCGDCFGADPPEGKQCCDTCEEVQEAYRKKGWAFIPDKVQQVRYESSQIVEVLGRGGVFLP